MEEALKAILPESLAGNAGLIAGAITALLIFILGWIASKWAHRLILKVLRKRHLDEALSRFLGSIGRRIARRVHRDRSVPERRRRRRRTSNPGWATTSGWRWPRCRRR